MPPLSTRIPAPVARVLRRARVVEAEATGDRRPEALRVTRALLGGARSVGYHAAALAECLEIRVTSVRTRGGSDGWIDTATIVAIAELPPAPSLAGGPTPCCRRPASMRSGTSVASPATCFARWHETPSASAWAEV
jgi:hypothetical protein